MVVSHRDSFMTLMVSPSDRTWVPCLVMLMILLLPQSIRWYDDDDSWNNGQSRHISCSRFNSVFRDGTLLRLTFANSSSSIIRLTSKNREGKEIRGNSERKGPSWVPSMYHTSSHVYVRTYLEISFRTTTTATTTTTNILSHLNNSNNKDNHDHYHDVTTINCRIQIIVYQLVSGAYYRWECTNDNVTINNS